MSIHQKQKFLVSNFNILEHALLPSSYFAVQYANIVTLDLSEYDQPGGKERLAEQLRDSVHQVGMAYIIH
jgi:hypothetical protein